MSGGKLLHKNVKINVVCNYLTKSKIILKFSYNKGKALAGIKELKEL
jgi:hypothetical protein